MGQHVAGDGPGTPGPDPRAPLGLLSQLGFALRSAVDVDDIARSLLTDLAGLPGVSRVGFALVEGGGRRLRYVAGDGTGDAGASLEWCHIDAYDDVPLTAVVRTGEPVYGGLDQLDGRYAGVVERWRSESTQAMAAWPLTSAGTSIGGLLLRYDAPQSFPESHRELIDVAASRTSEAVRRVRAAGRGGEEVWNAEGWNAEGWDEEVEEPGERTSVLLSGDPRSVGTARRFLRDALTEWGVDEDASDTAQLCLSELVTNVVMHADTTCELTVRLEGDVLTVVVRDLGGSPRQGDAAWLPADGEEDPLQVYGRGLMLVDALADRWGSERDGVGTTAWFALGVSLAEASSSRTG